MYIFISIVFRSQLVSIEGRALPTNPVKEHKSRVEFLVRPQTGRIEPTST